ncbi:putative protein disulfide-isomerase DDB_G0275025 [Patella vulgata]|uniref:putative protein disulfide-isomerase DDB_G0275025 n=1 Tax=Patella vulgata TaxID=6465 RepID=UPI00217F8CE2|nr:putative protein disulfide-isomerase DDB_G0275025 [Patella vulgata]
MNVKMNCRNVWCYLWICCIVIITVQVGVVYSDVGEDQTAKFDKHESYRDIFPLSKHNFTQKVLKHEDAWVVLFHKGSIKRTWKTLAVSLRGVISFGMINVNEEPELLHKLGYDLQTGHEARVYPYGSKATKEKYSLESSSPNEIKTEAVKSIPNYILDVKNMGIEDFLVDSFMSVPSRFPLIIFTDSQEIQPMFKSLCLRLERYYNFGHMVQPGMSDLKQLGIENVYLDMPSVMVLTTETTDIQDPKFNAIQYMKSTYGEISYPNVLKFLININRKFRHLLAGDNMSNNKNKVEMTEVLEKESEKFDILESPQVHINVHSDRDFVVDNFIESKLVDEL